MRAPFGRNAAIGCAAPPRARAFHSTAVGSQASSAAVAEASGGPALDADLGLDDLIVTVKAARRLAAIRARAKADGQANADDLKLRLRVEGGGCSGFKYEFILDHAAAGPDDRLFTRDGVAVVTDTTSLELIRGSTLDWDDSMMRSAFLVTNNPNAEASCGCKSSFSVKTK